MITLGVTGGIGMGKSACERLLLDRGIPAIDTDTLSRQLVEPGQPALLEIAQRFGQDIIDEAGCLKRRELGERVFRDEGSRKDLEGILHPRIRLLWRAQVKGWISMGHRIAAVVIPLLFETSAETELDRTLCVACSARTQQERLLARGWTDQEIQRRLAAQWPIERKITASDFVIWTEGGMELHSAQLDRVLNSLSG